MRDYAKVAPVFWTRGSGRELRGHPDAQLVALYLFTCASANMIGLYYLPMSLLCHETGLSEEGASEALRRVNKLQIALYDASAELVFVANMAQYQIGPKLSAKDKRVLGIERELATYSKHPFSKLFFDRYQAAYHLRNPPNPTSPLQGPYKPLRSQEQDQEQEQEQEQDIGETRARAGAPDPSSGVVLRASAMNATDDRASGLAVTSWADGIRNATGRTFAAPRAGGELTKLIDALLTHCPDDGQRTAWAFASAREYGLAAEAAGESIHVHGYADWLNSGRRLRRGNAKPIRTLQPAARDGAGWQVPKAANADPEDKP